jgi:hypothetical protein
LGGIISVELTSPLWHKVAPSFLENVYIMVITEEEAVVSSKPEILPFILDEIKFFFQNGTVFNELSICHV